MTADADTQHKPPTVQSTFSLSDLTPDDFPDKFDIPPPPPARAFIHRAVYERDFVPVKGNIYFPWYWTEIDHPLLNGNRFAIIHVTPRGQIELDGTKASLRQNPHPVGVLFRENVQRWYIYNLNLAGMAEASFNVSIEERY